MGNPQSQSETLSTREQEIAEAFSGGESYNQIADRLCIAPATVRTHLSTVYRKLGVSSKLELHKHIEKQRQASEDQSVQEPLALTDKPSIAVLAFENMSGDPEQEYFSDGITEDIITALSRSPWLFVIARNTTFTYKGTSVDVKQVADDLGVRYILEGSVRRSGDRIRVTAQFIDGTTGGHLWSERYDGQLADVFDLQDEITRNVVASIQTQIHLTVGMPAGRTRRPDVTAWGLYKRGWKLLYDFTPESFATATSLLDKALVHDPDSAEATLILSLINHHIALMMPEGDYLQTANKARDLARRAVGLDKYNEYAHWAHGISCMVLARHEESIAALERAVELNPNCSVAYGSLGTALCLVGRVDEAIANQDIAIRSNPRDPSIFFRFTGIALAHYQAGRFDVAVDWASKSVHRMPQWYLGHFLLAACHVREGRLTEARTAIDHCYEVLPDTLLDDLDRMPLKDAAEMTTLRDCLRQAGVRE